MILIDSNIIIDVFENDIHWSDWSIGQMQSLSRTEALCINHIVVAEAAPRMGSVEAFTALLLAMSVAIEPFSDQAAFLAGHAFQRYRRNGGTARSVLPDFFIGGQAQALGATILTRDARFYRSYFPSVPLITPPESQ